MRRTDVESIAVLRALQLGDVLCATPALRALRGAHPRARITLLGLPWARELLPRFGELIDEVVEFPGFPGMPEQDVDARRLPFFFADMIARRFDLAVQLQGDGRLSNPVVAMLGARRSLGAYRPGGWQPGPGYVPYPEHLSEVERCLAVTLVEAGPAARIPVLEFPLMPADEDELSSAMPGWETRAYAVLHPGARDPRRRWEPGNFAAVAQRLAAMGLEVVLSGTEAEAGLHAAVTAGTHHGAISLAGQLSLGGLAALVAGSRLTVTNDTGVSHLAAAVGAPAVTVFVASDPARWGPPARSGHVLVGGRLTPHTAECCAGESCQLHPPSWRAVDVDEVMDAVDGLLSRERSHAA